MRISTKSRYGLRLMVTLAVENKKGPVFLKEIAEKENISEKYLSQIVIPLKAKKLINAYRGAHGGYVLSKPAGEINLKEIMEALEGDLSLAGCTDNPESCPRQAHCVTKDVWELLGKKMAEFLKTITLESLAKKAANKKEEMINYSI